MDIQTRLVHAGEETKVDGAVVTPIFQSATFGSAEEQTYDDIRYLRLIYEKYQILILHYF